AQGEGGARLVKVDCPAMTESVIESELFGHEKGAYTGAGSRHVGLIEEAQGGTVFFDEFGELPQRVQVKLLCLLQDRCIRRAGSTMPIEVDVRVVAATNRDLDARVASEQRERTPIPAPANVTSNNQRSRLQFAFSEAARDRLARYDYPGNVRELQKIVSKAVGASLSPLVAGMEFRIAFERLTIDEKAVADAIEATMPCEVADGRADLAGKCVVNETWEERELRHEEETKSQLWRLSEFATGTRPRRRENWA